MPCTGAGYEVGRGGGILRCREWTAGGTDGLNTVRVAVTNVPVEHAVAIKDFRAWLERPARSPRDVVQRARVREIPGLSAMHT